MTNSCENNRNWESKKTQKNVAIDFMVSHFSYLCVWLRKCICIINNGFKEISSGNKQECWSISKKSEILLFNQFHKQLHLTHDMPFAMGQVQLQRWVSVWLNTVWLELQIWVVNRALIWMLWMEKSKHWNQINQINANTASNQMHSRKAARCGQVLDKASNKLDFFYYKA